MFNIQTVEQKEVFSLLEVFESMNGEATLTTIMDNNMNEKISSICSMIVDVHFKGTGITNEEIFQPYGQHQYDHTQQASFNDDDKYFDDGEYSNSDGYEHGND